MHNSGRSLITAACLGWFLNNYLHHDFVLNSHWLNLDVLHNHLKYQIEFNSRDLGTCEEIAGVKLERSANMELRMYGEVRPSSLEFLI